MVVHGGCFHRLVIPYPSYVDLTNHSIMSGKAVLICRPNSHPFVDRTLTLDLPVKIGRSVARARATQTNGIFDCKVLSRNHALIWYSNGKFFLQDTKSSNGTFVNNQRLSKSGEDSAPREVSSGDIVQFGVDVLENARKVTHGCIVANLKLYLPDGKEAKASPSTSVLSGTGISVDELFQLYQHIQEALQREQMLQAKLTSLDQVVISLREAADLSWQALISEDRLLSRVDILEDQLQTYGKNFTEDKLREELQKLQEEKCSYQDLSKDCIQKVLQEKLEAVQKCQDIERALENAEKECASYREAMERNRAELQDLANKNNSQMLKIEELQNQLQEAEEETKETIARLELENELATSESSRLQENEKAMQQKIKQLEDSGEAVNSQLQAIQAQLEHQDQQDVNAQVTAHNERNGGVRVEEDNHSVDLVTRLAALVDMQKNFKEQILLTQAHITELQEEKIVKLYKIDLLEAELELHTEKLNKYKGEKTSLEQSLKLLEEQYKENNFKDVDLIDTDLVSVNGTEKLSNGSASTRDMEALQTQIDDLKEAIKESRSKVEAMDQIINLLQQDLAKAKTSLNGTTQNWLAQEEKLKKALSIKESNDTTVNSLCENLKSLENTIVQAKLIDNTENMNDQKEEATLLNKQLLEVHLSEKELEGNGKGDNKSAEELASARQQAAMLQLQILSLQAQINKLKLENSEKQRELQDISGKVPVDLLKEKESLAEELQLRVSEMEEELVLVKEKFMACIGSNTQLEQQLSTLRQDYEAIIHQPYFVRPHYILGLVLSMTIAILLSFALYPFTSDYLYP